MKISSVAFSSKCLEKKNKRRVLKTMSKTTGKRTAGVNKKISLLKRGFPESYCNVFTILEVLLYEFFVLITSSHSM